jgi:inosose dehydratase
MEAIRVGNAPCSWGMFATDGQVAGAVSFGRMLDEMQATGYAGTELGDWGILPTEPARLRDELAARGLVLTGAFVPVALRDAGAHAAGTAQAVRTARLLAAVAGASGAARPWLVLADANGADPVRLRHAGRVTPALGLSAAEWRIFAGGAERIAREVRDATGLGTVFHPHCAGFVETPDEIARLLELTDPALLGLVFDTGHYTYGAGRCDPGDAPAGLARFGDRVRLVHLKDCQPEVTAQARAAGWDYTEAVRRGVFCELGRGCVDFPAVVAWLRARGYQGWVVVEQDVLPGLGTPRESAARNRAYLAALGL